MSLRPLLSMAAIPLFVGLIAVSAALTSSKAESGSPTTPAAQGPLRCEIQKSAAGVSISLVAVVHSDVAVNGSYTFRVTSGGGGNSSNIQQGGPFAADAGASVQLGTVRIGAGGVYGASLAVTADGATPSCTDKAGAI